MDSAPAFRDVVVIVDDRTHPDLERHPPAGDPPANLGNGLAIERLPYEEAERVITACEGPGEEWAAPRQFSQLYSFVRRGAIEEPYFRFDADQLIHSALQLSRLVVPNSHCTDYAVRVLEGFYPHRPGPTVAPLPCAARFYAFKPATGERDWLTNDDAATLAVLLRQFLAVKHDLPERITGALWWAEWTSRIAYLQPAYVSATSSLESLISTDRYGLRAQFVQRVAQLADALEIPDVDEAAADVFYSQRSEITHGAPVPMQQRSDATAALASMLAVLRKALRKTIEDSRFAARFRDANTVRAEWPVTRRRQSQ